MKKAFIALAFVAATLLTVSCKKDNVAFSIKATINNYTHDTKVYVDDDNFSCWANGDEVKINDITGSIASPSHRPLSSHFITSAPAWQFLHPLGFSCFLSYFFADFSKCGLDFHLNVC